MAERRIATLERTNKNEESSTDRPMTSSKKKRKLKHLPTSLPYCLSWQTSDLGLSEWEQLKLVAWLDLASQDQVTAASRSSKPVHPKHGHLVPTPGDWWPVPAVRDAKRRSRSCWMNRSHSAADRVLSASSSSARGPTLPETRGRWPALPKQSFHAFSGLSARESCLSVAALYCRMCVIRKSFSHAPQCLKNQIGHNPSPVSLFPKSWHNLNNFF